MVLSNNRSKQLIDNAMASLGISIDMNTDISIIKEIFTEMNINDFETSDISMRSFLNNALSKPQNLAPLLSQIQWGLEHKNPAVVDFIEIALEKNWLHPSPYIIKTVHVIYILEALTVAMCNNNDFFVEYVKHIRLKERDLGIDSKHIFKSFINTFPASLNFFGTAKAVSLDMAMVYFRIKRELGEMPVNKEGVDNLYRMKKISFLEHKLLLPICNKINQCVCNDWLRINIYEAGITEFKNGFSDNAMAAHVLSEDILKHCHRETFELTSVFPLGERNESYTSLYGEGAYFPVVALDEKWVSLYRSWNMAFILGELNNLHYLFPKLLIPSVLCCKDENFLGVRIVSLWLSINSALMLNFNQPEKVIGPKNRAEMVLAWGEINKKYAEDLYSSSVNSDSIVLNNSFKKRFSKPYRNLFGQVYSFINR
ncbi:MAG: hypothetical protein JKY50_19665 [Oleispira sp.]|nr:hypothetical protein [Oleispira sp.]